MDQARAACRKILTVAMLLTLAGPVGAVTYGICLFACPRKSAGAFEINL